MNSSDILQHILPSDDSAFDSLVERIVSLVSEAKGKILQQIDDTLFYFLSSSSTSAKAKAG
ncbi:MAG: hypothetical protein NC221_01690 [Duncaniella sp.]|nr:hypothetical protein [Muribaculum sp.]MCM1254818.1 hypothetical protein [Duncaniella sp.]